MAAALRAGRAVLPAGRRPVCRPPDVRSHGHPRGPGEARRLPHLLLPRGPVVPGVRCQASGVRHQLITHHSSLVTAFGHLRLRLRPGPVRHGSVFHQPRPDLLDDQSALGRLGVRALREPQPLRGTDGDADSAGRRLCSLAAQEQPPAALVWFRRGGADRLLAAFRLARRLPRSAGRNSGVLCHPVPCPGPQVPGRRRGDSHVRQLRTWRPVPAQPGSAIRTAHNLQLSSWSAFPGGCSTSCNNRRSKARSSTARS